MNKVPDNKLSSLKVFFSKELEPVLGVRECKIYFERCAELWLGKSKSDLILEPHSSLTESEILKFLYGIKAFKNHTPLAHVLGEQYFYGLRFKVDDNVLVPRPETEELVDLVVKESAGVQNVLDVGTGSGCIAISIKKTLPNVVVTAIDLSEESIRIAENNSLINNVVIDFKVHDALELNSFDGSGAMLHDKWDVIVSNPPYIPIKEKANMDKNVVGFDPHMALFVPDDNPLLFYDVIGRWAIKSLADNGKLYFEIHEDFGKDVCELLDDIGFVQVHLIQDLQGKDRIVKAIK
jgi:release factor glutamine methyltransferase